MIWIQELNPEVCFWIHQVADLTKLGGAVDSPKGQEALQSDLDTVGHLAISSRMKCNKGKCQVLHLGWSSARQVQAGEMSDWRRTQQKGIWGCWVTADSAWARKCIQVAKRENYTLGYIKHSTTGWSKEMIFLLFSIDATSSWILCAVLGSTV